MISGKQRVWDSLIVTCAMRTSSKRAQQVGTKCIHLTCTSACVGLAMPTYVGPPRISFSPAATHTVAGPVLCTRGAAIYLHVLRQHGRHPGAAQSASQPCVKQPATSQHCIPPTRMRPRLGFSKQCSHAGQAAARPHRPLLAHWGHKLRALLLLLGGSGGL